MEREREREREERGRKGGREGRRERKKKEEREEGRGEEERVGGRKREGGLFLWFWFGLVFDTGSHVAQANLEPLILLPPPKAGIIDICHHAWLESFHKGICINYLISYKHCHL